MATAAQWSVAYARQADADFRTWELLQGWDNVAECHKLLFLQMACEKLTKAHLFSDGIDPDTLQSSHAFTAKNLPIIIRQQVAAAGIKPHVVKGIVAKAKHLAQEIELLAPAVKRGGQRPDNCEYPWQDDQQVLHLPLDWTFTPGQMLTASGGRTFLKLVKDAIRRFLAG